MTQDEAVKAVDLLIFSLHKQAERFPHKGDYYFLVSVEVANHLSDYAMQLTGKMKFMLSGDEFLWKGFKCKVA